MTYKDISTFNLHGINSVSLSVENIILIIDFKKSLTDAQRTYDELIAALASKYSIKHIDGQYAFPASNKAVMDDVNAILSAEVELKPVNFMTAEDFFKWIKENGTDFDRIVALKEFLVKK